MNTSTKLKIIGLSILTLTAVLGSTNKNVSYAAKNSSDYSDKLLNEYLKTKTSNLSAKDTCQNVFLNDKKLRKGISGTIVINGITYKWIETSAGRNRGITFNPGQHAFTISPNPHQDPWYNKNQVKFYNTAATEIKSIGDLHRWTKETRWAIPQPIIIHGVPYKFSINE